MRLRPMLIAMVGTVLVLTAVKDPAEVDQALRRVMAAIEQPIDLGAGRVVSVSAAVGTALVAFMRLRRPTHPGGTSP